jgi:hypothetical protein
VSISFYILATLVVKCGKSLNYIVRRTIRDGMSAQRKKMTTEFGSVWDATDPAGMHERIGNLWLAWIAWVVVLEDAEVYLGGREVHREHKGEVVMPMLLCVRAMLLGYAIECALKALWVRKGNRLIRSVFLILITYSQNIMAKSGLYLHGWHLGPSK